MNERIGHRPRIIQLPERRELLRRYKEVPAEYFRKSSLRPEYVQRMGEMFIRSIGEAPITPQAYLKKWEDTPTMWVTEHRAGYSLSWDSTAKLTPLAYDSFFLHDMAFPLFKHILYMSSTGIDINSLKWRNEVLKEWNQLQTRIGGKKPLTKAS